MHSISCLSALRRCTLALVATISWTVNPAHAAQSITDQYSIAPVPNWVEVITPAIANTDSEVVGGQRYVLLDRQHYDDGNLVAYHQHYVTEVVGQAGLSDSSKLSISFDPAYQRLELHAATVLRDGQKSDRLQRARVDVARTEDSSDDNLLHGEMTALVVLPDVRVGDQVEVRYTVFGENPVFGSTHHSQWRVRWSTPIDRSELRITVPQSVRLNHTPIPKTAFKETTSAGLRTLHWQWDKLQTSEVDSRFPAWLPHPDVLQISGYQHWQEVADWGATLFANHSAQGESYRNLTQTIQRVSASKGLDAAIAMAIDHVQKNIRYYGLELGENSHRPHAPDVVLNNGYGDCKDKTLLLVSLLDDLGVNAWPILVSTYIHKGIVNRLPSPGVFNHVVVLVEHKGEQYWVDATDNSQSGELGLRGQPEYGAGLVLGKPTRTALITRKAPVPTEPTTTTHDKFYLSSYGGPADFFSTSIYRGRDANSFRQALDESGKRKLSRQYQDFYEGVYGDVQSLAPLDVSEDKRTNTITVTERYRLHDLWKVDKSARQAELDTYAFSVRQELDETPDVRNNRTEPLPVRGPLNVAHRIQFFPNIASTERPLEEKSFGIDGFQYSDTEYLSGDSLVFESSLKVSTTELEVSQIKAYNTFRNRVFRNAQSGRYLRDINTNAFKLGSMTTELLEQLGDIR